MKKRYHLRKVYTLLVQGFTEAQLRDLCLNVPEFRPVYDQLPAEVNKDDIIRQLFEHAQKTSQFDLLLAWAKNKIPANTKRSTPTTKTLTRLVNTWTNIA
jgi:hypothetical protein